MATKRFIAKNGLDNSSLTITNVADPVNAQDAATRAYVLANASGGATSFQRTVTSVTPAVSQTVFTITYTVGYIDVFLNGVKLVVGDDFTASNGTSITLVNASLAGDNIEFIVYSYVTISSANLTGVVTSIGSATSLGSFTSAQLLGALTDETGTGSAVFATSPTLVMPTYTGTLTGTGSLNITGASRISGVYGGNANATNIAIGDGTLLNNTTGFNSLAFGAQALSLNTTGYYNVAVGYNTLRGNITGSFNTAVGTQALNANTTIINSFGTLTGGSGYTPNLTAVSATLVWVSGSFATTYPTVLITTNSSGVVTACTFVTAANGTRGGSGFKDTSTVMGCSTIGAGTGFTIATESIGAGDNNSAFGMQALYNNTIGWGNSAFGLQALYSNTVGYFNTSVGANSLYSNSTGTANTACGKNALFSNTTGNYSVALGYMALTNHTTGFGNVALGYNALYAATTGSSNISIGQQAGEGLTTGSYNLLIGWKAGEGITTGSGNVIIGSVIGLAANLANNIIIGDGTGAVKLQIDANGNMITTGAITGGIGTIASAATITPTTTDSQYNITALAVTAVFAIPSGSSAAIEGQKLTIRIKDNGTARTLSWTTTAGGYRVIGTTLPLTTVASKTIYVGCIYNSADSFWDVVSVASQV